MLICYYLQTESGDSYLEVGKYESAEEFEGDLMDNIEGYYPVGDYTLRVLDATEEEVAEVRTIFDNFVKYSWEYKE